MRARLSVEAVPKDLMAMLGQPHPMLGGDHLLSLLNNLIHKFKNMSTVLADQMIMVSTSCWLIATLGITKVMLMGNACLCKQPHGPVDGRMPDPRHRLLDQHQQLIDCDVPLDLKKYLEDGSTLSGAL